MSIRPLLCAILAASLSAGCQSTLPGAVEPDIIHTRDEAPPGAAPGTCWGKDITPAVVETVTEQIILQPAEILDDGTVLQAAVYKTETRQAIIQERKVTWFETPCREVMTPDFVASVQRALKARGLYRGPVTAEMNNRTRAAIRAFQKPEGLDSGILSLAAARKLGLVAMTRDNADLMAPQTPAASATTQAVEPVRIEKSAAVKAEEARLAEEERARLEAERVTAREAEEAARAEQAEQARRAAELAEARKAEQAARAEKTKRQAEVDAALEAERRAKEAKRTPLPISSESE